MVNRSNIDIYKKIYSNIKTDENVKIEKKSSTPNETEEYKNIEENKIQEEIIIEKKSSNEDGEKMNKVIENKTSDLIKDTTVKNKDESNNKLEIILGMIVYNMALITSGYHTFKYYSFFEQKDLAFIALFITIAIEMSIFYFSYVYTKYKIPIVKFGLYLFSFYIQLINFFIMEKNFTESFIIFKTYDISFIIPFVASLFIPLISVFSSISVSKILNQK